MKCTVSEQLNYRINLLRNINVLYLSIYKIIVSFDTSDQNALLLTLLTDNQSYMIFTYFKEIIRHLSSMITLQNNDGYRNQKEKTQENYQKMNNMILQLNILKSKNRNAYFNISIGLFKWKLLFLKCIVLTIK